MKLIDKIALPILKGIEAGKRYFRSKGGTRSGKTHQYISIIISFCVAHARANQPLEFDITSRTVPHLEGGAIAMFKKIMLTENLWNERNYVKSKKIYSFSDTCRVRFFGCDDASKVFGWERDCLFINEAQFVKLSVFDQLAPRTRKFIMLDWNPTVKFWAYYLNLDDCTDIVSTYLDNLDNLPAAQVKEIESRRNDPHWWRIFGQGLEGIAEGLIYKDIEMITEAKYKEAAGLEVVGLDFGYNDPSALCYVKIDTDNLKIYIHLAVYEQGVLNFVELLQSQKITSEQYVVCDSARPEIIATLQNAGFLAVGVQKFPGSRMEMRAFTRRFKICYTETGQKIYPKAGGEINALEYELENHQYEQRKIDEKIMEYPADGEDHAIDAFNYAAWFLKKYYNLP